MKRRQFEVVVIIILIIMIIIGYFSITYLFSTVPQEKSSPVYFQNIVVSDKYNSTLQFDIKFTTEKPDFIVKEKIHVNVQLKRIYNNSIMPLSAIDFALVTSDGHYMPFQGGYILGERLDRYYEDLYFLEYDTYLNLSGKYSCRFILNYVNLTYDNDTETITKFNKIDYEEIFVGPLLEVQPISVNLQIKWTALQIEATNKTISLALLVIVLTLLTILLEIIKRNEKNLQEILIGLKRKFYTRFIGGEKMNENKEKIRSYHTLQILFKGIGIFLLFLGGIKTIVQGDLQLGLAISSIGLAMYSIGITFQSSEIAYASDEKMKIIASADFMEVVDNLSSYTKQNLDRLNDSDERINLLMRWLVGIRRAVKLKDFASQDERDSIAISMKYFMQKLPWDKKVLENHEIILLIDIYTVIWDLNIQESKDDLIKLFEKHIGERQQGEDDTKFFERILNRIEREIDAGNLKKVFTIINDKPKNDKKINNRAEKKDK